MTGSRILQLACLVGFTALSSNAQRSDVKSVVSLTPAIVEAGSPELIVISTQHAKSISGEWLGHKVQFFQRGDKWIALAGVDVEGAVGPSTLRINAELDRGGSLDLSQTIEIHPAHYRTGKLTVPPKFVEPGPDEQKIIAADAEIKAKIFATSAAEPLWHGDFRAPVLAQPTDSFGTRRMFNGKLASIHKGMDFRAPMGTVVRAANSGVVVLARPFYYEGNCVIDRSRAWAVHAVDALQSHRCARGTARGCRRQAGSERCDGARDGTASALGGSVGGRVSRPG